MNEIIYLIGSATAGELITDNPSKAFETPGLAGFSLELDWNGTDTDFTLTIFGTNKKAVYEGTGDWKKYYTYNAETGANEHSITLATAEDGKLVEIDEFKYKYCKIVITNSSGNVAATVDVNMQIFNKLKVI